MLRSSLCGYSDSFRLAKGTISVTAQAEDNPNNIDKKVVFKNCAPFIYWKSQINNKRIDNVKYIDMFVPMFNLIKYSDNY